MAPKLYSKAALKNVLSFFGNSYFMSPNWEVVFKLLKFIFNFNFNFKSGIDLLFILS